MKLNDNPMTDWYWLIDDGTNNMKQNASIWLMDIYLMNDSIYAI